MESKQKVIVHPYFLIQRNGDWYLLCHDSTNNCSAEISLSFITHIDYAEGIEFIPNNDFDFKDYYKKAKLTA